MYTSQFPYLEPDPLVQVTGSGEFSHTHSVHFYEGDDSFLDKSSEFIAAAINKGAAVIVIAEKVHRDGLVQRLQLCGVDVSALGKRGRYVALDSSEILATFMVDGLPDPIRFFNSMQAVFARTKVAGNGHRGIVVLGGMVTTVCEEGNTEAAIRLERLWNQLAREYPFSLRCAYPMSSFCREEHGSRLLDICEEHSHVIPGDSYTGLESEAERLRAIAYLQRRARALENEIAQRMQAQEQLQRREAELADFLENAVEGVQQVGPDHRVRWANKSLLRLLGYTAEEYVGHDIAEFYAERHVFEEYWHKLMRQEDMYDFPAELRCKDGSARHVLLNSNGLWENSRFIHTRCFVRDVTDQKRMEEALRYSEKLAVTGRLAAAIAHEINNPLEALTNLLYLLEASPSLDSTARSYAVLAGKELHRVAHITKQMLAFYRHSADPVPVRLSEILDGIVELYEAKLIRKGINIKRHYTAEQLVWGFPSDLRQLFANLLGNAIEAAGDNGTIRLHLFDSCDWTNPNRRGVRISIADSGSGISPAIRKKLFEPFFTTKGESGTGLGLWVSKGIAQKHEGTIQFRSSVRPGRSGTVFSVFLPTLRYKGADHSLLKAA